MANHTITIINNGNASSGRSGSANQNQSSTSARGQFITKKRPMFRWAEMDKEFGSGSNPSTMGSGAVVAMASIKLTGAMVQTGINIYASYQEAKSGEKIKYDNMRAVTNYIFHPMSFVKQSIWDYGVIRNMELKRENETLNYQRQLTGNVIYAKNYNNGSF